MADSTDLLPCPFCGSTVTLEQSHTAGGGWYIRHVPKVGGHECGMAGFDDFNIEGDLAAAWNTRIAGQAELRELLRELYDWSNGTANGLMWRFADQPIAKKVAAALAPLSQAGEKSS